MPPKLPDISPQWQVDRHVPIALIATLLIQTAAAVWWLSGLAARVSDLERQAAESRPSVERLIRLETRFESVSADLKEIKELLRPMRPALSR